MKLKVNLLAMFSVLASSIAFAQMHTYQYSRALNGITADWHRIYLPDSMFGKIKADFSDIRILGVTSSNDTVEAPYIVQVSSGQSQFKNIPFALLNQTYNSNGFYFTFETPSDTKLNRLQLQFKQTNFDWRVSLEGSANQQDWFTIIQDYRILSIANELTQYQFTQLVFPTIQYKYLRLCVHTREKPQLISAEIPALSQSPHVYKTHTIQHWQVTDDKQTKQTIIDVHLPLAVPISLMQVHIRPTFDFYRPITIQYLADSTQTQKGWQHQYRTLFSGHIHAIDTLGFSFNSQITNNLRVIIENQDNQPLTIAGVSVKGFEYSLMARFNEKASYALRYGNAEAQSPSYDLTHFSDKIPSDASMVQPGPELVLHQPSQTQSLSLFKHKGWLWGIMVFIMLLLGGFTLHMMRKR